jgi:UDPglucose--hexose-1-phosphate uridylyltransferase
VAIAPARGKRPGADVARLEPARPGEFDECPFCEGREERTPPEVLALPREGREPNTPGWTVRVVPNLYPAVDRQEVVIHSPEHVRSFTELGPSQIMAVAEAWRLRATGAPAEGSAYVHAIVNEGGAAGASLPHSHSQLIWLPETPPEAVAEEPNLRSGSCALCRLLDEQRPAGPLLVDEDDGVTTLAAPAGRVPYELLIAPDAHAEGRAGFDDPRRLAAALGLLAQGVRRVFAREGPVPWNAWLHNSGHWHIEVVPRLTVLAGLELGARIYINALPPEQAAAALRR